MGRKVDIFSTVVMNEESYDGGEDSFAFDLLHDRSEVPGKAKQNQPMEPKI